MRQIDIWARVFKLSFISVILLTANLSFAKVTSLISSNGQQGTLLIQGNDGDAKRLFDLMNVFSSEVDSVYTKEISSVDQQFSLLCSESVAANSYSCTLKVQPGKYPTKINKMQNEVFLAIVGLDAKKLFDQL